MGNIFGVNSKLMIVLNRIVDIVLLNIIFIITCIPIVTIGASLSALYTTTFKMIKKQESYIVKSYFVHWKENAKQSTIIWLIIIAVSAVIYYDVRLCTQVDFDFKLPVLVVLGIMRLGIMIISLFVFPIIAKFEAPTKNMIINSIFIPLSNLVSMLTVILITVVPTIIALNEKRLFLIWCYALVMGGFSLTAYINSFFLNTMFARFEPKIEEENLIEEMDM